MDLPDPAFASKLRDLIRGIVSTEIDRLRPRYKYATVVSFDRLNRRCLVNFPGNPDNISIAMGSVQPSAIGQVVRVAGLGDDRYVEDVMGVSYSSYTPDSSWTAPTLINSWANYGGAFATAGFRKDGFGRVFLRGLLVNTTMSTFAGESDLFVLPTGYRPGTSKGEVFTVYTGGGAARVDVYDDGRVAWMGGGSSNNTYFSISGISFLAGG